MTKAETSGGWRGMNGTQRRFMLVFVAGFFAVVTLILIANAESSIADLAASGAHVPDHLVWSWEWSSMIGWLSIYPFLWWVVARLKPPRLSWPQAIAVLVSGSLVASAWHIAVMVAIRHLYYSVTGDGPYRFFDVLQDRLMYEYRKDVTTYVQFVLMASVVQWFVARAAERPIEPEAKMLTIVDGTVRHAIPISEIESVRAAGNYVEVIWAGRTLLHRATLTATIQELGHAFVRIHRSQLVRRNAIRQITSDKSGDFVVVLLDGTKIRGSRRYRPSIEI